MIAELGRRGTELHLAEVHGLVKDRLVTYGIYQRLGADHFHPTLGRVVKDYVAAYPDVVWLDWEDEPNQVTPKAGSGAASDPAATLEDKPSPEADPNPEDDPNLEEWSEDADEALTSAPTPNE